MEERLRDQALHKTTHNHSLNSILRSNMINTRKMDTGMMITTMAGTHRTMMVDTKT
jgi:hypothetical protein